MMEHSQYLSKDEVCTELWLEYTKTPEYFNGEKKAISELHPLVRNKEEEGLKKVYNDFVDILENDRNAFDVLKNRAIGEWMKEWKMMHKNLFGRILKKCGDFRKHKVRFGDVLDEDYYKIPDPILITSELAGLVEKLIRPLDKKIIDADLDEKCLILAKIHYQFIRIHPFADGNGRIARVLTDQMSICFNLTAAMGGYPRHNTVERKKYHEAIRACAFDDPECKKLANWIKGYIEKVNKGIIG